MTYRLKCLICGHEDNNLVAIQEHAMDEHGYAQDDHRRAARRQTEEGAWIYTMPDGIEWLMAKREK